MMVVAGFLQSAGLRNPRLSEIAQAFWIDTGVDDRLIRLLLNQWASLVPQIRA